MKQIKIHILVLLSACIGLMLIAGCGGGGGGTPTQDTSAPVIANAKADTSSLTFEGGDVTITANVTDDSTVSSVVAALSKSGTLISQKVMTISSGSTYQTVVSAPANTTSTPVTCTVVIYASDSLGYQSHTQISFNVPVAGDSPPTNPF